MKITFISRDFKEFLGNKELPHVRTSVGYPQGNGKIEVFIKRLRENVYARKVY
jgi:transposase InsO family protein